MRGQSSPPDQKTSLPLQIQRVQDVAPCWSTRALWTGLGLAVFMLIGVSACALYPPASHDSAEASTPSSHAFGPMPWLGPIGSRPVGHPGSSRARPRVMLPAAPPRSNPAPFPVAKEPRVSTRIEMSAGKSTEVADNAATAAVVTRWQQQRRWLHKAVDDKEAAQQGDRENLAAAEKSMATLKPAAVCIALTIVLQALAVRLFAKTKVSPLRQEVVAQDGIDRRTRPRLLDGESLSTTVQWYENTRPYTRQELLADRSINFLGAGLAWLAAIWLGYSSWASGDILVKQASFWLHGAGLIIMTNASAIFHYWAWDWKKSALLLSLDHIGISAMIAGCYAPVMIHSHCYRILAFVCCLGLAVVPLEAVRLWQSRQRGDDPARNWPVSVDVLHIVRYLVMGWACVLVLPALWLRLPTHVFQMIYGGGLLCTAGVFAHVNHGLQFHQAIWHGTVLLSSSVFYLSNLLGLVGLPLV